MRFFVCTCLVLFSFEISFSQEKKGEKVTYEDHVKPVFREHCFSCHNQNKKEGDLDLTNYTSLMQGGGSGEVIEPGEVGDSYLFALVNHDDEPAMPPEQPKISDAKLAVISKWIELGALETSTSKSMIKKKKKFDFALSDPAVGKPTIMPLPATLDLEPENYAKRTTGITAITTSPWAPLTAISGQKQVLIFDSKTRKLKGVLPFPEGTISVLKFSRNGSLLLAGGGRGGSQGKVIVWNIKYGERIIEVGDELDTVLAADISSDQKLIALGGPQKMIRVYSTSDNSLVYEIKKHTDWVTSLEFSPDGVLLCTGDRNGGVYVWEATTGREYLTLKAHSKSITGISWRSDSNIVATTSEDASIRLWEMNNGGQVKNWSAHGGGSLGVEFTRDGRLVSAGRDRYAKIWDQAGKQLFAFPVFTEIVMGVTHCDETNLCFAGDWTGEIRQFNAADGKQLATLTSNPQPLTQRLAAAQKDAVAALEKSRQLVTTATTAKSAVDKIATQLAASKKQVTDLNGLIGKLTPKMAGDQKSLTTMNQQIATTKTRVEALNQAIPEMKKAHNGAATAAENLTTDPELKKLAEEMKKAITVKETELKTKTVSLTNLNTQLATLTKTMGADQANMTQYNSDLAAAKKVIASMDPLLKPAQDKYTQAKGAADASVAAAEQAKAIQVRYQQAIEFSQTFRDLKSKIGVKNSELEKLAINHGELLEKHRAAEKIMAEMQNAYVASKSKVEGKAAEFETLKTKSVALVKSSSTMKTEIAGIQSVMSQTQASVGHLNEAKAKIDQAKKASPSDSDVAASLQAMDSLIKNQTQKVSGYQATIKKKTGEMEKLAQELTQTQQKQAATEKMVSELKVLMDADLKQLGGAKKSAESTKNASVQAEAKVKQKEQEITALKAEVAKLQGIASAP
ncbi:MAG: c-type cytochrome domain-containing protein [Planctomycetota bacterium]|nr:c-type cytochrome domain-containing protein [Planctomycetota bacterium]